MLFVTPHDVLFKALSDPTRRALFEQLCRDGEQTIGELTTFAGISQPTVSKHIGRLKAAGLVSDRQQGRETRCRADRDALTPLADWTARMTSFWEARFDGLDDLLQRMDQ